MKKTSQLFLILFCTISAVLIFPVRAHALTSVTSAGVNGAGGFPVALSTAGETYQLTEDISCATTCFTIKASSIVLDLNGHTATFGTANNPEMLNTEVENWEDANTLSNWTVLNGTVTQRPAEVWGSYDAELSATASIKSDPVTLNAGQTYAYYAMIKGSSSDTCDVNVKSFSDNSTLASFTINSGLLNRAFAMADGSVQTVENRYKPVTNESVYLQLTCSGSSTKRLHIADIKPSNHYFIAQSNYRSTSYPDLADNLFSGLTSGVTITNGTINQGAGQAVKSIAINGDAFAYINNLNINMSGNNTGSIKTASSNFVIDHVDTDTSSILQFNRMHPVIGMDVIHTSGVSEIKNCTILNDPEQSIRELRSGALDTDTASLKIHDNVIRGREQVTEGYAISLAGGNINVEIYNNDINPYKGRGILLDSVAGGSLDGTKNISIHDNTIQNIYEQITPEYGATGLEAAGIRVRDWGGAAEGHRNLKIYDNNISVKADAAGTHRSYGINITSQSINTTAEIYNNTITADLISSGGSDWEATCVTLQGADMTSGGSVDIHNNLCNGDVGFRLGGNDGSSVKKINIYENDISTNKASVHYYGYLGPFADNNIYCNKITNTGATGYPLYFEDGTPTVSNQWLSNNQITNSNSGGYEVLLNKNYSSSVTSCGNGTLDIFGGGQIGSASNPCHDGFSGCYSTAGLTNSDTTPPAAPSGLSVM